MKFGKIFCYRAEFQNEQRVTWKVFAETQAEADTKVAEYLEECNGHYNVPDKVRFARVEDGLVLY